MAHYKEECIKTYHVFEHFEIKIKGIKKEVYIDGVQLDLSNIISVSANVDADGTELVVRSIRHSEQMR